MLLRMSDYFGHKRTTAKEHKIKEKSAHLQKEGLPAK